MKKIIFDDRYGLTQAVIDGRKTMTRLLINPEPKGELLSVVKECDGVVSAFFSYGDHVKARYKIGEIVAVAQSYESFADNAIHGYDKVQCMVDSVGWSNKVFVIGDWMPHQIRITDIRCEKLQDISNMEYAREGIYKTAVENERGEIVPAYTYQSCHFNYNSPRAAFRDLITELYGPFTWGNNPYVWAYEFELVK